MWWRLSAKEFEEKKGEGNRRAMKRIVDAGRVPGLLAYRDGEPVGWVSVAPREEFPRLSRSKILAPVDARPVWSVVCLFVAKEHRGRGIAVALLKGAVDYAREKGGRIVEGYAIEPKEGRMPDAFAYHGPAAAYRAAGFREVARRSPTRPIMRRTVRPPRGKKK
ncbi:MAG: GNAT family N-acetyltransferase [Candidatus Eisenbacteria bacterium]|nr:GNAT family N-acetyltransferase [Candidatus Eisenbacteria bacterium]